MPTCSLSSYLAASAKSGVTLFRQIVTLKGIYLANIECSRVFRGTPGETKNSSRESSIGLGLMTSGVSAAPTWATKAPSGGVWLGGTGWGVCIGLSRDIHGVQL